MKFTDMKGEKVRLRALEPEDLDFLYSLENDINNWEVSNTISSFSKFTLSKYLENSHENILVNGQFRWMICVDQTRVGVVDLFDFDAIHLRAGIGIIILDQFRNEGYASEAIKLILSYSKKLLNLHQLHCSIHSSNTGSIGLFKSLGFKSIGVQKDWYFSSGKPQDVELFQLILPQ